MVNQIGTTLQHPNPNLRQMQNHYSASCHDENNVDNPRIPEESCQSGM